MRITLISWLIARIIFLRFAASASSIVENDNWLQGKKEQLSSALEGLDKRSKEILMSRWLTDEKVTLKELAKQYQVSIERIRQIEEEAIQELREHLTEA